MEWMAVIEKAIRYIEEHITDELTIENIAGSVGISQFYFQKGLSISGSSILKKTKEKPSAVYTEPILMNQWETILSNI